MRDRTRELLPVAAAIAEALHDFEETFRADGPAAWGGDRCGEVIGAEITDLVRLAGECIRSAAGGIETWWADLATEADLWAEGDDESGQSIAEPSELAGGRLL
jgi:hypothetical protein